MKLKTKNIYECITNIKYVNNELCQAYVKANETFVFQDILLKFHSICILEGFICWKFDAQLVLKPEQLMIILSLHIIPWIFTSFWYLFKSARSFNAFNDWILKRIFQTSYMRWMYEFSFKSYRQTSVYFAVESVCLCIWTMTLWVIEFPQICILKPFKKEPPFRWFDSNVYSRRKVQMFFLYESVRIIVTMKFFCLRAFFCLFKSVFFCVFNVSNNR